MCNQVVTCLGGAKVLAAALHDIFKRESPLDSKTEKYMKKQRKRFRTFLGQVVDNPKTAFEMYGLPLTHLNSVQTYRKLLIEFKLNVELSEDSPVQMPVSVRIMKEIA